VVIRRQTYLNALYLLLAFPLGLFYFVFLVTGLSVGLATVIIWIGLLVLALVLAGWYAMLAFERQMAIGMLHEDIPPISRENLSGKTLWQQFAATLRNPVTWKGLVYLFGKFPLGLFSFSVLVALVSSSAALISLPFYYQYAAMAASLRSSVSFGTYSFNPIWLIDTLPEALLGSLFGLLLALISLHMFNGLAWISGKFARLMLGSFHSALQ
jgi:hypothetical protein